jgi:WD40 repeat protein
VLWQRAQSSANQAEASGKQAIEDAARAIVQEKLTNQYLYVAHMNMVQEAWDRGVVSRAAELLARQQRELRTFPWYYYDRLVRTIRSTPTFEHEQIITQIAFSPTHPHLALSGNEGLVDIWDFENKSRLFSFRADNQQLTAMTVYTADGSNLLWTGRDGKLAILNTESYTEVGQTRKTTLPWGVALSADSQHFAYANEQGRIVLGDFRTNSDQVLEQVLTKISCMAFAFDGSGLLVADDGGKFLLVSVKFDRSFKKRKVGRNWKHRWRSYTPFGGEP